MSQSQYICVFCSESFPDYVGLQCHYFHSHRPQTRKTRNPVPGVIGIQPPFIPSTLEELTDLLGLSEDGLLKESEYFTKMDMGKRRTIWTLQLISEATFSLPPPGSRPNWQPDPKLPGGGFVTPKEVSDGGYVKGHAATFHFFGTQEGRETSMYHRNLIPTASGANASSVRSMEIHAKLLTEFGYIVGILTPFIYGDEKSSNPVSSSSRAMAVPTKISKIFILWRGCEPPIIQAFICDNVQPLRNKTCFYYKTILAEVEELFGGSLHVTLPPDTINAWDIAGIVRATCFTCSEEFSSKTDFVRHQEEEKHYQCSKCNKNFDSLRSYQIHKKSSHTGQKYHCRTCQTPFDSRANLRKHCLELDHGNMIPCDFCDQKFLYESDIRYHLKTSHSEPKSFKCPLCSSCYSCDMSQFSHIREKHASVAEEVIKCLKAGTPIPEKILRPNPLPEFLERGEPAPNQAKKPRLELSSPPLPPTSASRTPVFYTYTHVLGGSSADLTDYCNTCGHAAKSSYSIKRHIDFLHLNPKQNYNYRCSNCITYFRTQGDYKKHIDSRACFKIREIMAKGIVHETKFRKN